MIHITHRRALPSDVEAMFEVLPPYVLRDGAHAQEVPDLWRAWLESGTMTARVIEQVREDGSTRVEAFGANVFLAQQFVEKQIEQPFPYLANGIYEGAILGKSPLMCRKSRLAHPSSTLRRHNNVCLSLP